MLISQLTGAPSHNDVSSRRLQNPKSSKVSGDTNSEEDICIPAIYVKSCDLDLNLSIHTIKIYKYFFKINFPPFFQHDGREDRPLLPLPRPPLGGNAAGEELQAVAGQPQGKVIAHPCTSKDLDLNMSHFAVGNVRQILYSIYI